MTELAMLRLAKAFLDIALWRKTPAHLPASLFLLALVACVAALTEVFGALLPPPPNDQIPTRILLTLGLPLAFTWVLLAVTGRRARFLQTASALLGVGALAACVLYPLDSLLRTMGENRLVSPLVGLLWTAVFIGYLLACVHIWRAALDRGLLIGCIVTLGYLVLSVAIEHQVLPQS